MTPFVGLKSFAAVVQLVSRDHGRLADYQSATRQAASLRYAEKTFGKGIDILARSIDGAVCAVEHSLPG
jgi:hypothetical protein